MDKYISALNFKMICIPRSKPKKSSNTGLVNESYNTEENSISDSKNLTSTSGKHYSHLLEEEPLQSEISIYPTTQTDLSQKTTHKCNDSIPCCPIRRSTILLHLYIPLYSLYLLVGAVLFSLIEGPIEKDYINELREFRMKFLQWNTCVSDSDLEELILEILRANNRGVSAAKNVTGEPNWSFGQSFFFSSTIVTTIGYGHVHPLSEGGKIFSIIYAVIGIPMTFILITALVERSLVPSMWMLNYMNLRLQHLYQPVNIRVFHLSLIGFLGFIFFMVLPAMLFANLETDWNFLDSLYYCFISLTTIGLGDYIPGDAQDQIYRPLYKLCIAAYLILGLTAVMLILHLYNDIPQLNLGFFLLRRSDEAQSNPEKVKLKGQGDGPGHKYTQNNLEHPDQQIQQVKMDSCTTDSTTPDANTPVHVQMPPISMHNH